MEAISNKLFMSKRKLQYLFANNQTTYKKTLNKIKVELAVMHLHENPNLSIKKLLSMSGFNSHSSANIAFKKEMGVGLSEYKRQISNVS
ncbi:helix-turn-helix transcriptional regulator [Vibrio mimicus]